ncbi:hypothetical protein L249_5982 [Ophiocordyceps polyrhachis-furcata BCC 54312]|uniref:Uncharacterized protein n=1 Tax=Ophiocordyceps polyrhachis-furcata BCC 54312 TaxID=1330021 RepID=A0A367LIZ9_9HYPO|nr:hypothetical protein L249_5982 [Ophiocordyceps polyrhachis-furcata BCC 54312]
MPPKICLCLSNPKAAAVANDEGDVLDCGREGDCNTSDVCSASSRAELAKDSMAKLAQEQLHESMKTMRCAAATGAGSRSRHRVAEDFTSVCVDVLIPILISSAVAQGVRFTITRRRARMLRN